MTSFAKQIFNENTEIRTSVWVYYQNQINELFFSPSMIIMYEMGKKINYEENVFYFPSCPKGITYAYTWKHVSSVANFSHVWSKLTRQ